MEKNKAHAALAMKPLVRTSTLTAAAFEKLVSQVVSGAWQPGEKIPPERQLCLQFGIARAGLREALKALELIGLIESRIGDGTFVCPRSEFLSRPLLWAIAGSDQTHLRDIVEARQMLEEDMAAMAAERSSREELEAIGATVEDLRRNLHDTEAALKADMDFHIAIANAAHNQILLNSVQLLRNLMRHWLELKLRIPNVPERVLEQHTAIFRAIELRDRQAAREGMSLHLTSMGRLLVQVASEEK
ncbi:MAG: FadR family transcriptional regulator [Bryobacteraceae bacterium]|nr:FadR family transcriptional regulator [Bryobacteraceae bacterium]